MRLELLQASKQASFILIWWVQTCLFCFVLFMMTNKGDSDGWDRYRPLPLSTQPGNGIYIYTHILVDEARRAQDRLSIYPPLSSSFICVERKEKEKSATII